jgi:quercetin dioxygenase-like cupin family protein
LIFALSPSAHDDARHRVEHGLEDGTRLVWELLDETPPDAQVSAEVELGTREAWIARLDRVDFPPGGVAYRHVHPGPGIRRILHGELTIDRGDVEPRTYRRGEAWFEGADDAVLASASVSDETAFVRVLLLPAEWAGRRTIRYLDPADEDKPRLQRATMLLEEPLQA